VRKLPNLIRLVKLASDLNSGLADFGQVVGQTGAAGIETARRVAELVPAAAQKLRVANERLGIGQGGDVQDRSRRDAIANALRTATYTPLLIGAGIAAHAGTKAVSGLPDAIAEKVYRGPVRDRMKHVVRRVLYEPLVGLRTEGEADKATEAFLKDPLRAKLDNNTGPVTRRQAMKMFAHDALLVKDDLEQAAELTWENAARWRPNTYLGQKARSALNAMDQIERSSSKDRSRLDIDKTQGANFRRLAGSRDALMRLNRVLSGLGGGNLPITDAIKAKLADKIRAEGVHTDAQILDIIGHVLPGGIGGAFAALRQHGREKALRANPEEWNRLARMTDDEIAREVHTDVGARVSRFTHMLRKQLQEFVLSAKLHTAPPSSAPEGVRPQVTELRAASPSSAPVGLRPQIIGTR
jgi:hypothetical protein